MIFLWFLVIYVLEMRTILFLFLLLFFVFLLYAFVFYVYCRVIPDVLSLMFFHVPPLGFLK